MTDLLTTVPRCYASRSVSKRMCEFLGGSNRRNATAAYIVGDDGRSEFSEPASPSSLFEFLRAHLEVERSLWDSTFLIADLDLEYINFDKLAAAWLDRERTFALQAPVVNALLEILGQAGLDPQILVTGRGFHLVWAIHRDSSAFRRLARFGAVPPSLEARYAQACSPAGASVDAELGRAYAGLGLVMEHLGHLVLAASMATSRVPVQITSIEVGPGTGGREIVSVDLSEYGDPLHTRHIRVPFSVYLKPRHFEWAIGKEGVNRLSPMFEIPLAGQSTTEAIAISRDADAVCELARRVNTCIPDQSGPMERLLDNYESSGLAAFHREFNAEAWNAASRQVKIPVPGAPRCVEWLLEHPNDLLLKPAALQHLARVLMALGWKPRAIAQLICCHYEHDFNWGRTWEPLDPCHRAMFYTRLFTGMIAMGIDRLIDMNCVSHKEKGYCAIPECRSNLVDYRDRILERRFS